jgi:hypothetical protein
MAFVMQSLKELPKFIAPLRGRSDIVQPFQGKAIASFKPRQSHRLIQIAATQQIGATYKIMFKCVLESAMR